MKTQLKHIIFILIVNVLCLKPVLAQKLFHQDVFYGGVTSAGWSGMGGTGSETIEIYIEPGSTIRNAWLFMYRFGKPDPPFFLLNDEAIYHEEFSFMNEVYHFNRGVIELYYLDIKDHVDPNNLIYSIEFFSPENYWGWYMPVLYIEYDNPNLEKVATSLWYNDQDFRGLEEYTFFDMNPMENTNDVGLSLMLDHACSNLMDRTFVWFNGTQLTTNTAGIGGNNHNSTQSCAGVRGHFYYQQQELFGLDSAVPDSVMDNNDALANISPYLNNYSSGYELRLQHWQWPPPMGGGWPNYLTIIPHAYTTPCDTFSTAVAFLDTTICRGDSVVISASGGNNYTWLDSLMATPNNAVQMVSPDSSRLYVVKIENEPGCFRTEQVFVKVNQPPDITNVSITPSVCGEATGHIGANATGASPFISSIGAGDQNQAQFSNLASGDYNLTISDQNGCSSDTLVTVPDSIAVQAGFIADPSTGPAPLSVLLNNTSENATDYEWFINNGFWDDEFNSSAFFDTSGVFEVMLIAYNNTPNCADTFLVTVDVRDSLIVQIPNVFTPNNDGVNDLFTIAIRGAKHLEGNILNRWGNEMIAIKQALIPQPQTLTLWDGFSNGQPATEGVYFYKLTIKDTEEKTHVFQGYFHLKR